MTQTYPLHWIVEGTIVTFIQLFLWPMVMAYFTTWRLYRLHKDWKADVAS